MVSANLVPFEYFKVLCRISERQFALDDMDQVKTRVRPVLAVGPGRVGNFGVRKGGIGGNLGKRNLRAGVNAHMLPAAVGDFAGC